MTGSDFGLSIIASWIANKIGENKKSKDTEDREKVKTIESQEVIKEIILETEVSKLSKRFKEVFLLMNEKRGEYNKFTIANVSEILGLDKRSILDDIVNGKVDPSFEFIKNFCDKFRINYQWLNESKGEPFRISYTSYSPMGYLDDILKLNPENIYFIQNNSEVSETFIMLGFSDWYYMVGTKIWHISSHVGHGGQGQIYDLYRLIKSLKENMFYTKCHGLKLEEDEFNAIINGRIFPGSCLIGNMGMRTNNPWWDDFTDINNQYIGSDEYERMYGKSFIDAQNIVKDQIKRNSIN